MKRILGIGLVLALVVSGLVLMNKQSDRLREREARSATRVSDSAGREWLRPRRRERATREGRRGRRAAGAGLRHANRASGHDRTRGLHCGRADYARRQAGPRARREFRRPGRRLHGSARDGDPPQPIRQYACRRPEHIVQIVNSQMAIFTKKGKKFDTTGRVLYGPVPTNNVFKGFGGQCERSTTVTPWSATTSSRTGGWS